MSVLIRAAAPGAEIRVGVPSILDRTAREEVFDVALLVRGFEETSVMLTLKQALAFAAALSVGGTVRADTGAIAVCVEGTSRLVLFHEADTHWISATLPQLSWRLLEWALPRQPDPTPAIAA